VRVTVLALVVVLAALMVPSALAGKPYRERVPIGTSDDFLPGEACSEAIAPDGIRLELVGGNEAVMFFEDSGRFMATARHVIEVTNLATGKSVVLNIQGSYAEVPQADGTALGRGSGTFGFIFLPGDEGPGDTSTGRYYLFTGTVRLVYDSSFVVTDFKSNGSMQDVCAMVAS